MKRTHWRKISNSNYLGSWDLEPNEKRIVTILAVAQEMLKANPQAEEQPCVVAEIKDSLPMVLNKTNLRAIEKALGSGIIEEWVGKQITIYSKKIKAFGETVDALRVEPVAPKPKAKPKLTPDRFKSAIEAIKAKKITAEKVIEMHNLTTSQIKEIQEL